MELNMDPDDPLVPMRLSAQDAIARNAVALQAPPTTHDDQAGLTLGHAMLDGAQGAVMGAREALTKNAPQAQKWVRTAGGFAAKAPGRILSGAEILTAKDKGRATAGFAGGEIGAELGALAPGAEFLTVPLGAWAGNELGKAIYDHRHAPQAAAQWLSDHFAHGFDNGMPPYSGDLPPYDR